MAHKPERVHQIWVGDAPPEWITKCMSGLWGSLDDRAAYTVWSGRDLDGIHMRNRALYDQADQYAMRGRVHQLRSDIARYEILWQFGGTYVDTDFEVRDADGFNHLLRLDAPWVCWERQDEWLSNAIMHFPPRHPFIEDLIRELPAHMGGLYRAKGPVSTSRLSGPQYMTRLASRRGWLNDPSLTTLRQGTFFPYGWNQLDRAGVEHYGDAVAVHHFANQRRIKGKDLDL